MQETEMSIIADIIYSILQAPGDSSVLETEKKKALALCNSFPLPY
jgi:glycine/serine hydroxymethyltransferase